ncbi:hypothetical protein SAMN04488498_11584 [Mesorhizobium albiziae]|uniref:Uncharacterized protein n=1 Tax=Neomesorhizobium albiziae TaxID=335020 RepID=A0A1I4D2C6_9HYPH|nr:hypothetical protein GCM10007937_00570 [Mesorhizobium albiziae]SFK87133.1 hypothetical protein SAMN04488498_11584 [Mesorhizobium albiziae]
MKTFFRDNGLTILLVTMFLFSVVGMICTGQAAHNEELIVHGSAPLGLLAYMASGSFLSALFENWESEFLQMAAFVILTATLFQRGSAESRDPDDPDRPNDELSATTRRRNPVFSWLHSYSLGIVLALLFIACSVQFELRPDARASLLAWLERRGGTIDDYAFSKSDRSFETHEHAAVCPLGR